MQLAVRRTMVQTAKGIVRLHFDRSDESPKPAVPCRNRCLPVQIEGESRFRSNGTVISRFSSISVSQMKPAATCRNSCLPIQIEGESRPVAHLKRGSIKAAVQYLSI